MHVALNGWFWDQPITGSGQYVRQLLRALAALKKNDLDLTLILPEHVTQLEGVPDLVSVAHAPTRFGGKLGKVWFEQRSFPAAVANVSADIAHVPYWGPPLSSPARLVVSVLDVIALALPEYRGGLLGSLYTSLAAAGAKGAGHILTLSEASKQDIIKHLNLPPEMITPTLLAADDRFSPHPDPERDEAVRRKYDLPDEFALYFGGFDVRKNVNSLLLAWTYVGQPLGEHVPLVLAGRPPHKWGSRRFPDMPKYARQLKIEDYLIWTGEIAENEKASLYRLAKVVVFPSLYEGFGLPVLEAMACGTPVVAGNVSSIPEVAGEAAYLVDPENAREMGGAILALLVQEDLHQHMSNMARGHATQFSWRKTALGTLSVYEKVMQA
jgi:glycosyltransferase involved in cell wall biosynthesis